jgi:AAA family ATP:ADP antiporter
MWSVSLFWSVAADIFDSESAKRLFGPIAAAGTVGAIASSLLASQMSGRLGVVGLWIAAAIVLQIGLLMGLRLESTANQLVVRRFAQLRENSGFNWTGGLDGVLREVLGPIVKDLFTSPYLLGITVYICLIALGGTTVYSLLNYEVGLSFKESADRVSFFAGLNLGVQLVTVVLQSLLSASLLRTWGVGRTLMLLPLAYLSIFALLGWRLNLTMVSAGFVLASSLAYGLTVPARELLFTVVDKSAKYRTKAVIDTVLFRSFDFLASLGVELSLKQQYLFGYLLGLVAISSAWCGLGYWLGKEQQKKAAELEAVAESRESKSDQN